MKKCGIEIGGKFYTDPLEKMIAIAENKGITVTPEMVQHFKNYITLQELNTVKAKKLAETKFAEKIVEVPKEELSPEDLAINVSNKSLGDVLSELLPMVENETLKSLLKILSPLALKKGLKLKIVSAGEKTMYDEATKTIFFNRNEATQAAKTSKIDVNTVVASRLTHEIIHALTVQSLNNPTKSTFVAVARLEKLIKFALENKDYFIANGINIEKLSSSPAEFLAAISDAKFVQAASNLHYNAGSGLVRMLNEFINIIAGLIGNNKTVASELTSILDNIISSGEFLTAVNTSNNETLRRSVEMMRAGRVSTQEKEEGNDEIFSYEDALIKSLTKDKTELEESAVFLADLGLDVDSEIESFEDDKFLVDEELTVEPLPKNFSEEGLTSVPHPQRNMFKTATVKVGDVFERFDGTSVGSELRLVTIRIPENEDAKATSLSDGYDIFADLLGEETQKLENKGGFLYALVSTKEIEGFTFVRVVGVLSKEAQELKDSNLKWYLENSEAVELSSHDEQLSKEYGIYVTTKQGASQIENAPKMYTAPSTTETKVRFAPTSTPLDAQVEEGNNQIAILNSYLLSMFGPDYKNKVSNYAEIIDHFQDSASNTPFNNEYFEIVYMNTERSKQRAGLPHSDLNRPHLKIKNIRVNSGNDITKIQAPFYIPLNSKKITEENSSQVGIQHIRRGIVLVKAIEDILNKAEGPLKNIKLGVALNSKGEIIKDTYEERREAFFAFHALVIALSKLSENKGEISLSLPFMQGAINLNDGPLADQIGNLQEMALELLQLQHGNEEGKRRNYKGVLQQALDALGKKNFIVQYAVKGAPDRFALISHYSSQAASDKSTETRRRTGIQFLGPVTASRAVKNQGLLSSNPLQGERLKNKLRNYLDKLKDRGQASSARAQFITHLLGIEEIRLTPLTSSILEQIFGPSPQNSPGSGLEGINNGFGLRMPRPANVKGTAMDSQSDNKIQVPEYTTLETNFAGVVPAKLAVSKQEVAGVDKLDLLAGIKNAKERGISLQVFVENTKRLFPLQQLNSLAREAGFSSFYSMVAATYSMKEMVGILLSDAIKENPNTTILELSAVLYDRLGESGMNTFMQEMGTRRPLTAIDMLITQRGNIVMPFVSKQKATNRKASKVPNFLAPIFRDEATPAAQFAASIEESLTTQHPRDTMRFRLIAFILGAENLITDASYSNRARIMFGSTKWKPDDRRDAQFLLITFFKEALAIYRKTGDKEAINIVNRRIDEAIAAAREFIKIHNAEIEKSNYPAEIKERLKLPTGTIPNHKMSYTADSVSSNINWVLDALVDIGSFYRHIQSDIRKNIHAYSPAIADTMSEEEFIEDLAKRFPTGGKSKALKHVKFLSFAEMMSRFGNEAVFLDGIIYVASDGKFISKHAAYHELFHLIFNNYFTADERAEALDKARKEYGNFSDIELEERMANDFVLFKRSKGKFFNSLKELFRSLLRFFNFFTYSFDTVQDVLAQASTAKMLSLQTFEGRKDYTIIETAFDGEIQRYSLAKRVLFELYNFTEASSVQALYNRLSEDKIDSALLPALDRILPVVFKTLNYDVRTEKILDPAFIKQSLSALNQLDAKGNPLVEKEQVIKAILEILGEERVQAVDEQSRLERDKQTARVQEIANNIVIDLTNERIREYFRNTYFSNVKIAKKRKEQLQRELEEADKARAEQIFEEIEKLDEVINEGIVYEEELEEKKIIEDNEKTTGLKDEIESAYDVDPKRRISARVKQKLASILYKGEDLKVKYGNFSNTFNSLVKILSTKTNMSIDELLLSLIEDNDRQKKNPNSALAAVDKAVIEFLGETASKYYKTRQIALLLNKKLQALMPSFHSMEVRTNALSKGYKIVINRMIEGQLSSITLSVENIDLAYIQSDAFFISIFGTADFTKEAKNIFALSMATHFSILEQGTFFNSLTMSVISLRQLSPTTARRKFKKRNVVLSYSSRKLRKNIETRKDKYEKDIIRGIDSVLSKIQRLSKELEELKSIENPSKETLEKITKIENQLQDITNRNGTPIYDIVFDKTSELDIDSPKAKELYAILKSIGGIHKSMIATLSIAYAKRESLSEGLTADKIDRLIEAFHTYIIANRGDRSITFAKYLESLDDVKRQTIESDLNAIVTYMVVKSPRSGDSGLVLSYTRGDGTTGYMMILASFMTQLITATKNIATAIANFSHMGSKNPFIQTNFFKGKELEIVDHDSLVSKTFVTSVTDYTGESPSQFMLRNFIFGYLLNPDTYIQFLPIPSNRPNIQGVRIAKTKSLEELKKRSLHNFKHASRRPSPEAQNAPAFTKNKNYKKNYKKNFFTHVEPADNTDESIWKAILEQAKFEAKELTKRLLSDKRAFNYFSKQQKEDFINQAVNSSKEQGQKYEEAKKNLKLKQAEFSAQNIRLSGQKNNPVGNKETIELIEAEIKKLEAEIISLSQEVSTFENEALIAGVEAEMQTYVLNFMNNQFELSILLFGDHAFFKHKEDETKRIQIMTSTGMSLMIDETFGLKRKSKVLVIEDLPRQVNLDYEGARPDSLGKTYDESDAMGYMLPEYYEKLATAAGVDYGLDIVVKGVYGAQTEYGEPQGIKYQVAVLTDELVANNPALNSLRDKMRALGADQAVFESGVKMGAPQKLANFDRISESTQDSLMEIDMAHYRVQFNPIKNPESKVSPFTQLPAFLNMTGMNKAETAQVFNYLAEISKSSKKVFDLSLGISAKGTLTKGAYNNLRKMILKAIQSLDNAADIYRLLSFKKSKNEYSVALNTPVIAGKVMSVISSKFASGITRISAPGSKFILTSQTGIAQPLKFKDENGYTECLLPSTLRGKIKEGEHLMIAVRIPTTGEHSSLILKVVGFIEVPENSDSNQIILPGDVSFYQGSDYDIDSLFALRPPIIKDEHIKALLDLKAKYGAKPVGNAPAVRNSFDLFPFPKTEDPFVESFTAEQLENLDKSIAFLEQKLREAFSLPKESRFEATKTLKEDLSNLLNYKVAVLQKKVIDSVADILSKREMQTTLLTEITFDSVSKSKEDYRNAFKDMQKNEDVKKVVRDRMQKDGFSLSTINEVFEAQDIESALSALIKANAEAPQTFSYKMLKSSFGVIGREDSVMERVTRIKLARENKEVTLDTPVTNTQISKATTVAGTLNSPLTQAKIHEDTLAGAGITGIGAYFAKAVGYLFSNSSADAIIKFVTSQEDKFSMKFNGHKVQLLTRFARDKETGFRTTYGTDIKISIIEYIDTIVNLAIDNVKEQKLHFLGITDKNANSYLPLIPMGFSITDIATVFAIEKLKASIDSVSSVDSEFYSKQIGEIQKEFNISRSDVKGTNLTSEDLFELATKGVTADTALKYAALLTILDRSSKLGQLLFVHGQIYQTIKGYDSSPHRIAALLKDIFSITNFKNIGFKTRVIPSRSLFYNRVTSAVTNMRRTSAKYNTLAQGMDKSNAVEGGQTGIVIIETTKDKDGNNITTTNKFTPLSLPHIAEAVSGLVRLSRIAGVVSQTDSQIMVYYIANLLANSKIFNRGGESAEKMAREFIKYISSNMKIKLTDGITNEDKEYDMSIPAVEGKNRRDSSQQWVSNLLLNISGFSVEQDLTELAKLNGGMDNVATLLSKLIEADRGEGIRIVLAPEVKEEEETKLSVQQGFKILMSEPHDSKGFNLALDLLRYAFNIEGMFFTKSGISVIFDENSQAAYSKAYNELLEAIFEIDSETKEQNTPLAYFNLLVLEDSFLRSYMSNFVENIRTSAENVEEINRAVSIRKNNEVKDLFSSAGIEIEEGATKYMSLKERANKVKFVYDRALKVEKEADLPIYLRSISDNSVFMLVRVDTVDGGYKGFYKRILIPNQVGYDFNHRDLNNLNLFYNFISYNSSDNVGEFANAIIIDVSELRSFGAIHKAKIDARYTPILESMNENTIIKVLVTDLTSSSPQEGEVYYLTGATLGVGADTVEVTLQTGTVGNIPEKVSFRGVSVAEERKNLARILGVQQTGTIPVNSFSTGINRAAMMDTIFVSPTNKTSGPVQGLQNIKEDKSIDNNIEVGAAVGLLLDTIVMKMEENTQAATEELVDTLNKGAENIQRIVEYLIGEGKTSVVVHDSVLNFAERIDSLLLDLQINQEQKDSIESAISLYQRAITDLRTIDATALKSAKKDPTQYLSESSDVLINPEDVIIEEDGYYIEKSDLDITVGSYIGIGIVDGKALFGLVSQSNKKEGKYKLNLVIEEIRKGDSIEEAEDKNKCKR